VAERLKRLLYALGLDLDDEFVDRYVDHVVELVLTGIGPDPA
jgi:hypothetical protein